VYYQIRFQEISSLIENIIVNQPFQLNEQKNSLFKTIITLTIFQPNDHCWKTNLFLEPLSHRFWKLTLKYIVRFRYGIEQFNIKTIDTKFLVNLYVDLQTFVMNKPSNSILATFRHLQAFSNDYSDTILTEDECKQFQIIAMEEITKNYYELCSEILSSVRKMEDSIQRLRRVRESSKALSSMTQSMTTSSTASLTDDNKIRMQIQHDVNAYTTELKNLDIQIESSNKLTILNEESRLQI
ncbi:unnamed protein product, partial [Rotaria sp. Silwood2]